MAIHPRLRARIVSGSVARAITDAVFDLAEGPVWDAMAERVRWVDIRVGRVLSARVTPNALEDVQSTELGQTAGAVAPAADGGLLIAGARGLMTIAPSGEVSVGPDLLGARRGVRFNDGAVDPQGRFVVGTLSLTGETGAEVLLRISADGTVETLREDIRLSNGVAFSPDGTTIFHVDTLAGAVSRHSYGPGSFDDEPWEVVIDRFPGYPDGMTVDADGTLWVAIWGGSCVQRFSPDGALLDVVAIDARQVSCPAFVGPELDILVATTAQEGLTDFTDRSGAIFAADVGARGLPAPLWAGSTTAPYWTTPREEKNRA